MKKTGHAFMRFIAQIRSDMMLVVILLAPLLMGLLFRFVVPMAETALCEYFHAPQLLDPYYGLFDLLLLTMTAQMFCFCGVMVMLEEIDSGVSSYMMATPLGKSGYLFSRIGLPTLVACVCNVVVGLLFFLTDIPFWNLLRLSVLSGIMSIISALLVISCASNKVEGMALVKLCGFLFLGLPVPFFLRGGAQYLAGLLPSLWFAKYAVTGNPAFMFATLSVSFLWIVLIGRRFSRKLFA